MLMPLVFILVLFSGCAHHPLSGSEQSSKIFYVAEDTQTQLARYAPIVAPQNYGLAANRIGKPKVRLDSHGRKKIYVDPRQGVYYAQKIDFTTDRARYTNLVYRIHFQGVPFRLIPFNLTYGKNVGLFMIVTINERGEPVLFTTVHTCGCYISITPTSYLAQDAYPDNWDIQEQNVFGEHLPGRLNFPARFDSRLRLLVKLRDQTHRVADIEVADYDRIASEGSVKTATLLPMAALRSLPVDGETTSFFREQGFRKGYVKGSFKPFELLFMSWWALDLNVGVDKDYGDHRDTGTIFYTSLRPWKRSISDMWNFSTFLKFWGWRL